MKRTRKWEFVKQEAQRLAGLGLSGYAIAKRIGVNESSISRWAANGRLVLKGASAKRTKQQAVVDAGVASNQTPAQWAASMRSDFALDATDEQLVAMGEAALLIWRDPASSSALRFQAMREFRSTVKQLNLIARLADQAAVPEAPKRKTFHVPQRSGGDPRARLTAVK